MKLYLTIPAVPPSVNNYVRHTRKGFHYKTAEAKTFATLVALSARGKLKDPMEASSVVITITLGPKMRGDLDNFPKVILDSLVQCGAIRSDASITRLLISKCRGLEPQTEVWIDD